MAVIEAISTVYLEADASSVLFDDIPQTYEHLQVRISGKSDRSNVGSDDVTLRLGDSGDSPVDTGSNYYAHGLQGSQETEVGFGQTPLRLGRLSAVGGAANAADYGMLVIDILDYRNGSKNTSLSCLGGCVAAGTAGDDAMVTFSSGLWLDVAAVNAVQILPTDGSNLVRGTEVSLYGLNSS